MRRHPNTDGHFRALRPEHDREAMRDDRDPLTVPDEPTAPDAQPLAPPKRDPVASALDRARVRSALFGKPFTPMQIGRFTLLAHLGAGGMGEVFAAYDDILDRKVAIKLVRTDVLGGAAAQPDDVCVDLERGDAPDGAQSRLLREAQTLARLSHPNVVQVHEAGAFHGRVYIAMEYVRGPSLRAWLESNARLSQRMRTREVLRQFVAVGRGLEAAHQAGLVHRDFKPDNVLIGEDGRPRVLDFGLARLLAAPEAQNEVLGVEPAETMSVPSAASDELATVDYPDAAASRAGRPLERQTAIAETTSGRLLGTLPYMAPEQMRGEPADSRSDQFSFCVALYEALYQQHPFPTETVAALRGAAEAGNIAAVPAHVRAPGPVHRAILRGLSPDRAERFPNIGSLLDVLTEGLQHRRQRRALLATVLVACVAGGAWYTSRPPPPDPCALATTPMDTRWNADTRQAMSNAMAATGLPDADASFHSAAARIDAYVTDWKRERVQACAATHVYGTQSVALLDRRVACLDSGPRELGALLDALRRADASAVQRAVAAAEALPVLEACRDPRALVHGLTPPGGDQVSEVDATRARLANAGVQARLGHSEEALQTARAQLVAAKTLGYAPVHAEALFHVGRILVHRGGAGDATEGERLLREASDMAEGERHDELVAMIWNDLVLSGYHNQADRALALERSQRAFAAIRRIGDPPSHRAVALRHRGLIHFAADQLAEAERDQRDALALVPAEARFSRALDLQDLGNTLRGRNKLAEAVALYHEALALLEAEVGAQHPRTAAVRFDLAMLWLQQGELERARTALEALVNAPAGADVPARRLAGQAHLELAEILRQQGHLDTAAEHAAACLRIYRDVYPPGHEALAAVYTQMGALAYRRGQHAEAVAAYEAGLAIVIAQRGENDLDAGILHANIAEARVRRGAYAAALADIERARPVVAPHYADMPELEAFVLGVRGRALVGLGQAPAALRALEQAVARFADVSSGYAALERADVLWALVQTRDVLGRGRDEQTRDLARQALDVYRAHGSGTHELADAVARWLSRAVEPAPR
jgi:serine/threonine protein kinase/tetratricopeptide (TPR) repeat protein